MGFTISRILFRMIKRERDFSFVDKIGTLTNTLIATIPHTELQRNGQYGALVIVNPVYRFESQLTQAESNFTLNVEQEFDGEKFSEYLETVFDISQKVITTIKKATGSLNDLKSVICLIEGKLSPDLDERTKTLLEQIGSNAFVEPGSEIRQASYIWQRSFFEYYLNITKDNEGAKVIFATQDFQRNDMAFANIRSVADFCLREFRTKVMDKLNG